MVPITYSSSQSDCSGLRLNFELLFRVSRDGVSAAAFHRIRHDKSSTVSVISNSKENVIRRLTDKASCSLGVEN